jgi:hypothetical protein
MSSLFICLSPAWASCLPALIALPALPALPFLPSAALDWPPARLRSTRFFSGPSTLRQPPVKANGRLQPLSLGAGPMAGRMPRLTCLDRLPRHLRGGVIGWAGESWMGEWREEGDEMSEARVSSRIRSCDSSGRITCATRHYRRCCSCSTALRCGHATSFFFFSSHPFPFVLRPPTNRRLPTSLAI